ncbi:hypothetical protein OG413_45465 [Streptomyces sp. NBC_01433]|uniref:hypothetical protein n=1 Tax=Streptomyces sp. NBC_01433 TaxID=2903864 RepID=UPI002255252C|nr:hypothetical protein [Streptomyces sp. NBC_01433]MCX4681359.1 hypothetical protein [Streptomyces sp. NBC_01433]MCX4681703.1 hypothetical protein [Streptomyces sp. NBC_01433]MCX4682435.1 hypothetical protein [Streptomyces sp. NBC_01433]
MLTLRFALNEVLDVATHSMLAPRHTLRATYDQCQNEEDVHAALWWLRDRSGTYLTGNSTHPGAPRDVFAQGYGPGGDDASGILGADDRVIDAFPLHDPNTRQCLHSDLIRAHRDGHNTLTITLGDDATDLHTLRADVPIAPHGLTTYTQRIVDLAASKELRLTWKTGKAVHLLRLAARGPHGVNGHVIIGARSGKVLRATLTYPSDPLTTKTAKGTNDVRDLLTNLAPSPCPPRCTAPSIDACLNRAPHK